MHTHKNIWDHFGISREEFSSLPESRQLHLLRKIYFDHLPSLSKARLNTTSSQSDASIGNAIKNSSNLTMTKVIENGGDRSELTLSTANDTDTPKKMH